MVSEASYVQCELLRSVNARRLITQLGVINLATSTAVERVIRTLLGY